MRPKQAALATPDIVRDDVASSLGDLRFRALLSDDDWAALPLPIRRRFSKRLAGGHTLVYVGEVLETRISRAGWWLAQAVRLIGAPLPTCCDAHVPSVVSVTEDMATGGQIWTRLYARRKNLPQVIHSSKRFAGPTGLEEYVGYGIGRALTLHVEDAALVFRSAGYFVELGRYRIWLPRWLTPGALGDPRRIGRRSFYLEARDHASAARLAHIPVRRVPRNRLLRLNRPPAWSAGAAVVKCGPLEQRGSR
jgi:Domain of unknown function (DUF4166)